MLIPAGIAVYGLAKLNNKSARDRQTGRTALKVAAVWGVASAALTVAWMWTAARAAKDLTEEDRLQFERNMDPLKRTAMFGLPIPRRAARPLPPARK